MDKTEEKTPLAPVSVPEKTDQRTAETPPKPVNTILLDSSPLLLNTPSVSSLLAQCHRLCTTQSVLSEIRDVNARARVEGLYMPFMTIRSPRLESVKLVRDFARRTGDLAALSRTDIEVLALAYELECELNGGDWRLRRVPGQKDLNGPKPPPEENVASPQEEDKVPQKTTVHGDADPPAAEVVASQENLDLSDLRDELPIVEEDQVEELDSDSGGWITPSNIKKHQANETKSREARKKSEPKLMQVATMTNDFAMQNILLHMNLNLLSPRTSKRITHLKHTILRCHGCFKTTKEMERQFCPNCGKPTLTRVSCTTDETGKIRLHLKKNMQWNNKGNVYSIPKPVTGKSNQKWTGPRDGGGKKGWGRDLILAEDQKEFVKATGGGRQKAPKEHDLMSDDYLPGLMSGERTGGHERVRVGAGRSVNTRKR